MTSTDAPLRTTLEDPSSVQAALLDLIELVESRLDHDRDEVRALRRALAGKHRPQDKAVLAGRFRGSRLCVVRSAQAWRNAVEGEVSQAPGVIADFSTRDVVVLVPGLPRQASSDPGDRVARVIARVHRVAPDAVVGVSTVLDGVHHAPRGFDEARRALAGCQPGKAVFADNAWFEIALSRMRDSARESLAVEGPLSRLDDPLKSGADLRQTLVAWLEADGDVRRAAARLHLHPNTLRYRLRRAAEIAGLDLADPVQRFVAYVALTS